MPDRPQFHEGCPLAGLDESAVASIQDRIIIGTKAAKGLRLDLTLRDIIAIMVMLLALSGVWYSLANKVDAYAAKMESHLQDDAIHPSVLARQALIDERVAMKQAEQNANFKRLDDQITDIKIDLRDIKANLKGNR